MFYRLTVGTGTKEIVQTYQDRQAAEEIFDYLEQRLGKHIGSTFIQAVRLEHVQDDGTVGVTVESEF